MAVFITKVWGFSEACGPLQFGTSGWRTNAVEALEDGDLVVLVGTQKAPTDEDERGKLLGIMEPTKIAVSTLDFDLRNAPWDFDEQGNYKWPYGLLNSRAWILEDRPFLRQISNRRFNMDAAQGIFPLTEGEAAGVLELARREVDLRLPIRARARVEGQDAARRRGAPPPTTTRRGVMHMRHAPAFTYCMELEGARDNAFKIGWAFEYAKRQRHFNQASMPALGGIRYRTKLFHLWDTAREAFAMEQKLLKKFDLARHRSNTEVLQGISYDEIERTWTGVLKHRNQRRE